MFTFLVKAQSTNHEHSTVEVKWLVEQRNNSRYISEKAKYTLSSSFIASWNNQPSIMLMFLSKHKVQNMNAMEVKKLVERMASHSIVATEGMVYFDIQTYKKSGKHKTIHIWRADRDIITLKWIQKLQKDAKFKTPQTRTRWMFTTMQFIIPNVDKPS